MTSGGLIPTLAPRRPVLRWHGGKWLLAPWIIRHMPPHRIYVEPFGGAGSVLMRKPRAYSEIWNDLDGEAVNLFRVLRGPRARDLVQAVSLTPFARDEFDEAYEPTNDDVERARRLLIRAFMGFGTNGHARRTGFRANSTRSGTTPTHDWCGMPDVLRAVVERLQGVTIKNRDASKVMLTHDSTDTLHYVDPPYLTATRSDVKADYAHEMSDADHERLVEVLVQLRGKVILSGYDNPIYNLGLQSWSRVERTAYADGASPRTEVLWMNFAAADPLGGIA